jgi:hypothetical protein
MSDDERTGYVARLVTGDELIINQGVMDGVAEGDQFAVLDPRAMNVKDPKTGEDLGSIPRPKTIVRVTRVGDRISLAVDTKSGTFSAVTAAISGVSTEVPLSHDRWANGVTVGDPIERL